MQTTGPSAQSIATSEIPTYTNTFSGLKTLFRGEGIYAFGRGLMPRIISRIPVMGTTALVYELVLDWSKKTM